MADGFDSKKEAASSPEKQVRRWGLELKLAQKREKEWRKEGESIYDRYRGKNRKKNSFNVLWANTETLRPALYNSTPKPDVRRRYRQNDMLGKAVAELSERALSYSVDAYDMDACIKLDVLDALLPGRGVSRVRYIPKINQVSAAQAPRAAPSQRPGQAALLPPSSAAAASPAAPVAAEPQAEPEGDREQVEYEQAICDHVQWDDFLHGPGKTWDEVPWVGFKCKLTRDDLDGKFGPDIGKQIKLTAAADDDLDKKDNEDVAGVFQRAELWEIWDKEGGKVFFWCESYKKDLLYPQADDTETPRAKGEPPLKFRNFFPCPMPIRLVEDSGSLVPIPLYNLYREQADELDRISNRINKLVEACRVRFVHDPALTELTELMKAEDGIGIPAQNARTWINNGGLEKAIWWMPVEQIAFVLKELYVSRESCKQVIYEITGIADIVRGQSDPNETLGAQQIKANYASLRLQRMQREVQRYVRDMIRLLAEIIGEHFDPQTLQQMTGMNFPTAMQKQELQLKASAASQQGQPIPPELQNALTMPTWDEVMGILKSDMQREFRVDVETNSTVTESLNADMQGLKEVISGLVEFWQGVGPAVQSGALNIEAVKSISMMICRRARMGLEVEDALESGMQQPKPEADPNAAKAQAEQVKQQHQAQLDAQQQAHDQQIAQREQQREGMVAQHEAQIQQRDQQLEEQKTQAEAALEQQRVMHEDQMAQFQQAREDKFNRWKVQQDNETKIEVAEIAAGAVLDKAQIAAAEDAEGEAGDGASAPKPKRKRVTPLDKMADMHAQTMDAHGKTLEVLGKVADAMARPKRVVRGADGRMAGIETVQ